MEREAKARVAESVKNAKRAVRQKAPAEMNRAAEELEGVLREAGVTIDPNAQYHGSAARENPNDTVSDDAMDADFEEVDK